MWQAGGFSMEVNNTNTSNVMVGVRVLIGTQSIDRAPSYIDIFGRTLPVCLVSLYSFFSYVAAKATYIRLLLWQNGGFSALAP